MTYEYKLIFRVRCFDFTKIFDHDALNLSIVIPLKNLLD